ncbi:MAG: zinc ribbon domain-containing protein, partial [Clostridia bacterium]|nr:zinc ribbon domain-containing protein [Clostridia bacterium]
MFCKNCGKEFPEGAKFCDACGAKLEENTEVTEQAVTEELKETVADTPEAIEEKVAEAPVEDEPAPVAEAPKKKGLGKLIIAISAIVAVLGVTVFASFPYVKNFVEKTFS